MITDNMTLTSYRDAQQWASSFDLSDAQSERLADWIWDTKPAIGCAYRDHPITVIYDNEFWEIVDGYRPEEDCNESIK